MKKILLPSLFLTLVAISCGKEPSTGEAPGAETRLVSLAASFNPAARATVATTGVVEWSDGDQIGVYTTAKAIRTFGLTERDGSTAVFAADLPAGETPSALAVFPKSAFKSFDGSTATITYPASYSYSEAAMLSPMGAVPSDGSLAFTHLGGLIAVDCGDVPSEAASFRLTAAGRRITGDFSFTAGSGMSVSTAASEEGNSVSVSFTPGTAARRFGIPVPAGSYPSFEAAFYNAGGTLLYSWTLLENAAVEAGDMYLREPSFTTINGTAILESNTRVGLITDSSTGAGIPGVPVTDGYTYTLTDANGVYQFVAHADSRCVYPSVPAGYEIPLGEDAEPLFWKTGSYRNDFSLTPRSGDWSSFSVVAFSDVHLWNRGASQSDETTKYNARVLPDLNACIAALPDNVIILNTGDLVTNVTKKLADSRKEFAKIRKNGATVPMLPVIGNHDFNNSGSSTLECSQDWFDVYGPLDYSVNIGNAHIVCLNDMQYAGNNEGGYGKMMQYEKGLTDAQWEWLQADLATVSDKAGTLLLLCLHCPVFANDYPHFSGLRGLLRTFGEAHIFSGHNHYNAHRQFTDTWKGLAGKLSEEHNMPPLGGLWRSSLANDGTPMGYHVFTVNGAAITKQLYKAIGSGDASLQMRIYDGGASYHEPVADTKYSQEDADGKLCFDWASLWESSEGFDPSEGMIVRVFDAGTRGLNCNVYYTSGGVRYPMKRISNGHRDQCAFSFFWNAGAVSLNSDYASAYAKPKPQTWWYYDAPVSGSGWKVEVEFVEPAGSRWYESSSVQTDYTGFAW